MALDADVNAARGHYALIADANDSYDLGSSLHRGFALTITYPSRLLKYTV